MTSWVLVVWGRIGGRKGDANLMAGAENGVSILQATLSRDALAEPSAYCASRKVATVHIDEDC